VRAFVFTAVFAKLEMDLNPTAEVLHPEVVRVARAYHAGDHPVD
jgi:hypothetical protein